MKLHLLLPVTAKGYAASALEPGARGRDSGMLGLSLPRCHFLSGPGGGQEERAWSAPLWRAPPWGQVRSLTAFTGGGAGRERAAEGHHEVEGVAALGFAPGAMAKSWCRGSPEGWPLCPHGLSSDPGASLGPLCFLPPHVPVPVPLTCSFKTTVVISM